MYVRYLSVNQGSECDTIVMELLFSLLALLAGSASFA